MFRKLKLQFIVANLAIILVLIASLSLGASILLQIKTVNHAEFFSKKLASGINSGIIPESFAVESKRLQAEGPDSLPHDNCFVPKTMGRMEMAPPHGHHPSGASNSHEMPPRETDKRVGAIFYVKTNLVGRIVYQTQIPISKDALVKLVRQTLKSRNSKGITRMKGDEYYFYRATLRKTNGKLIIFQDLRQDQHTEKSLVISLIAFGSVYVILALFGSLFIAGRAIEPIQKAWQQQKDFVADASHELRTPLAVIQTNLEVVMDNPDETVASQNEWLNNIHEELQQMTVLVSSMLFLARSDTHQSIWDKSFFDLDKLLTRVCDAFKPLAAAKGITINSIIQQHMVCYGDESTMRQVVVNLLDNAIRHTPHEGSISVGLEQVGKKMQLSISDTGEGIADEHLGKIFDRFYQVDSSRSKGKSGLGLTIVKCIVENHGGTIQVSSQLGSGTMFIIHLPLVKEKEAGIAVAGQSGIHPGH